MPLLNSGGATVARGAPVDISASPAICMARRESIKAELEKACRRLEQNCCVSSLKAKARSSTPVHVLELRLADGVRVRLPCWRHAGGDDRADDLVDVGAEDGEAANTVKADAMRG